jgi:hypothetical protein
MRTVVFFGGNGHAAARLAGARAVLDRLATADAGAPFELVEAPYPAFEGRPRARDLPEFLATVSDAVRLHVEGQPDVWVYATGIGSLLALAIRLRGGLGEAPLVLQGPVLWGLEHRWMPRLARAGAARAIGWLLAQRAFQRRFARRHFVVPPSPDVREAFFDGYARCPASADLFRWCGPQWLRELESAAAPRPAALERVEVWWGGPDRVVGPAELRWTEEALGVRWPERTFPEWGHYPMLDDPEGWVRALAASQPSHETAMMTR